MSKNNAPFSVNLDSSMEIANEVRTIMDASSATGISAIDSGICGNSGKLSWLIPAILVRDLPHVIFAQWFSCDLVSLSFIVWLVEYSLAGREAGLGTKAVIYLPELRFSM